MRARRRRLAALAGLCLAAVAGCREVGLALGPTPALARARGGEALAALARRFGPADLDPALQRFRARVTQAMFSPSALFAERAAWPESDGDARQATYAGTAPPARGRYRLELRTCAAPARAADYRGSLRLRSLGGGAFEWTQRDELAIGGLTAADAARAVDALFRALEEAPVERAAPALAAALPRTGAALARAFSLERVALRRDAHGATVALLGARLRPERLHAAGAPGFARYLEKYVGRLRFKLDVVDGVGALYWQLDVFDGRALLHLRSLGGDLVTLSGAPRAMPDTLLLRTDFTTDAGLFRVGLRGLVADVRLTRAPREKAFEALFRREPDWLLPFIARPFLRAPLRQPFEGPGARVALGLREQSEGLSLLEREFRLAVRESWIVRFLGGLGSNAVLAFRRDAEEQADRFVFEALDALRQDLGLDDPDAQSRTPRVR